MTETLTPDDHAANAPWDDLAALLAANDAEGARRFVLDLGAGEQRRAVDRLEPEQREALVQLLGPDDAADLLEHLVPQQAVEILEDLPPEIAADVVEELPEDVGGDLLREMEDKDSAAILEEIEDAEDTAAFKERLDYDPKTAGGLMVHHYLAFHEKNDIGTVLRRLGEEAEEYDDQDVNYAYAVDNAGRLTGVLPVRDLVRTPWKRLVREVMIPSPLSVTTDTPLRDLGRLFDEKSFYGFPVVDNDGRLCGIVSRGTVRRALRDEQTATFLKLSGIISGEELRSMPFWGRSFRRLTWLGPNIILNLIAASVIAAFEDTLQAVIALAVFLPIVSDMSGCSGNQAVAVSIRELTLGVIRPRDFFRVAFKEGSVGIVNGVILGLLLGTAAFLWKGNLVLGAVVAAALALNTILSVLLGGLVPLALRRSGVDPALASGPILTTCTDMCGFFLVLSLASACLAHLG